MTPLFEMRIWMTCGQVMLARNVLTARSLPVASVRASSIQPRVYSRRNTDPSKCRGTLFLDPPGCQRYVDPAIAVRPPVAPSAAYGELP